jgi:hypothetical protein
MSPADSGSVEFVQRHVPALADGRYRLSVEQRVRAGTGGDLFTDSSVFGVAGERFTVDPAEVDSVFPPDGSQGDYVNVLPHVVLTRKTLPWERSADVDPGTERSPWLALLVFDELDQPPPVVTRGAADALSPEPGVAAYPGLELDPWEDPLAPCRTIDVPAELFARIAPSLREANLLTHARTVATDDKPDALVHGGEYAVVVANRLPSMGTKTTVHLVSIEGLAPHLPGDDGAPGKPFAADVVRLVALRSWRFDALREAATFATLLERVDVGPLQLPPPAGGAARSGPARAAADALARGYAPLEHRPREGGRTTSWYRGPLAPVPGSRRLAPISSSDAALRYDPQTGMLDVSYAVAWQLGRALGLASTDFAAALTNWRVGTRRETVALAEQALLRRQLAADPADGDLAQGHAAVRAAAVDLLRSSLPGALEGAGTPGADAPAGPRAPADPLAATATVRSIDRLRPDGPDIPAAVSTRLARLRLLKGVPFRYLVPDERMLHAGGERSDEVLRFFAVDLAWLDALVDGAFSIGRATTGDALHDAAHAGYVAAAATAAARAERPGAGGSEPLEQVSGLLLRSPAVAGWPGLEVTARGADGRRLDALRIDRLAPEVLLALFHGELASVDFKEPAEGLHFGLDTPVGGAVDPADFTKGLKSLGGESGRRAGDPLGTSVPVTYREQPRVVRVAALADAIAPALPVGITSAEFALQLVEGVDRVTFNRMATPDG